MKILNPLFLTAILLIAGLLLVIPVTAEINATIGMDKPSITVSVSPSSPKVGDTVIISGSAKGGNLTPGVSMWIFAGNYVNVTTVPVNNNGFYSKSIQTSEFPSAYYYIFVQHPGSDNRFNIDVKGFSGEVVNTNTGTVIFNFTGTGSVNNNAAAIALSNAFNSVGVDDVFSKTGVELLPGNTGANVTTTTVNSIQATQAATSPPTNPLTPIPSGTMTIPAPTKAPLSTVPAILGICLIALGIILLRKN